MVTLLKRSLLSPQIFVHPCFGTSAARLYHRHLRTCLNAIVPADQHSGSIDWLEGEGRGKTLTPVSLYASQLAKRKKLASVARVTASCSESGNPPENTIDNDLSTRWACQGVGSSITYMILAQNAP